jgi:putative glutamine amidotransferase
VAGDGVPGRDALQPDHRGARPRGEPIGALSIQSASRRPQHYAGGRVPPSPSAVDRPTNLVAVTATVRVIDGVPRVRLNAAYVRALEGAGLVPLVVPPLADPEPATALLDVVAGLVLTGGEDVDPRLYGQTPHPSVEGIVASRDATEIALARAARDRRLPTLAICRGAQVLNVALGGTLVQDIPALRPGALDHDPPTPRDRRVHDVRIVPTSRLAAAVGSLSPGVNSFHHQSVDRLGDGLAVVADAPDGVIEGVEATDPSWWAVAVQWHPEELTGTVEDWDRALFAAFAAAVDANVAVR